MLTYAIVIVMGLAGYAGAPGWLVLPAAACLTLDGWWVKFRRLGCPPRMAWSAKATTYFVTGIVLDICLAALGLGLGRIARAVVG